MSEPITCDACGGADKIDVLPHEDGSISVYCLRCDRDVFGVVQ